MFQSIERGLETLKSIRSFLIASLEGLSLEQLNEVPTSFNNNILWNLNHIIATQQRLCYVRPGLSPTVDQKLIHEFQVGTKPERKYDTDEYESTRSLLFSSLDRLQMDVSNNCFTNFSPYETPYGIVIHDIEEAVNFLAFHEGMHCGYVMSLKRLV